MEKQEARDYALGIIKEDGLEPSPEFLAMAKKEKRGELTLEDIRRTLDAKYTLKKEMMFSMNDDPYVYPHTEILKNKFGERDEGRFRQIEADYTGLRIRELSSLLLHW